MSAIVVLDLEQRFGVTRVLSKLDLRVDLGEHVAITGPNGSGKTTLLRVLAGLLRPTSGEVTVFGAPPNDPRTKHRIGVLGHAPALYPRMTASENLRFWGRLYEDPDALDRGRDILTRLGLDPDDHRTVASYSQGMRQRVGVARALSTDPDVVFADEPLAGLDSKGQTVVNGLLRDRPTIVVATHDPQGTAATRFVALREGRLFG